MAFRFLGKTKRRRLLVIAGILAFLSLPGVLLTSAIYKWAIGYNEAREFVLRKIPADEVQPLRHFKLTPFAERLTVVKGLPLPARWSPELATEKRYATTVDDELVIRPHGVAEEGRVVVSWLKGVDESHRLRDQLMHLVPQEWGGWPQFVASFPSERALLHSIYGAERSQFCDSSLWPMFPPPKDYKRERVLLTAKRLVSYGGDFISFSGQRLFFYAMIEEYHRGGSVYVGRLDDGKVILELGLTGNMTSKDIIETLCGGLDAGTLDPQPIEGRILNK